MLVDAEYAELFRAIRADIPKVTHVLVYGGEPLEGQESVEKLTASAGHRTTRARRRGGRDDDLHVGHHRQAEGRCCERTADPLRPSPLLGLIGYAPDDVYITTGPLYHSGPGGFMGHRPSARPDRWSCSASSIRRIGCASSTTTASRPTFSAPTPIRMICYAARPR